MKFIMAHLDLLILMSVFLMLVAFLVVVLAVRRGTTKRLIEDLGLARHILVSWLLVPLFRIYFWLLEKLGKLKISVNSPIPWEEIKLIVAANHQMPKMQDTFLLAIIIFFLRPQNYLNPIRFFPLSTADEANFMNSWFFRIIGTGSLISVNRNRSGPSVIEKSRERFEEYGGIEIFYVERGRTKTAIRKNRVKKWTTAEGKELVLGRLGLGAAELALKTNTPIIPLWGQITGDDSYPKASPRIVLLGLLELLLKPKVKAFIDINHPSGPLRPMIGKETAQDLTKRLETALFETGEYQLHHMSKR